jgi:hypothetical protein
MNRFELKTYLHPKNTGLILSPQYRLSLNQSFKNLGLVAPTGSGKTTRYVIPNILNCQGNIVVTDPSGEIYQLTSGYMRSRGYKIQVLQPADPAHCLRFNPLFRFRSQQELKQIATTLGQHNAGKDPFWTTSAICLSALVNVPDKSFVHLGNVRWLLNNYGVHGEGIEVLCECTSMMRVFPNTRRLSPGTARLLPRS